MMNTVPIPVKCGRSSELGIYDIRRVSFILSLLVIQITDIFIIQEDKAGGFTATVYCTTTVLYCGCSLRPDPTLDPLRTPGVRG